MARLKKVGQNNNKPGAAAKGGAADGGAAKEKKNEPKQSHVRFFQLKYYDFYFLPQMDYLKEMVMIRYQAINKKGEPTKKTKKTKNVKAKQSSSESENSGAESD